MVLRCKCGGQLRSILIMSDSPEQGCDCSYSSIIYQCKKCKLVYGKEELNKTDEEEKLEKT